MHVHPELSDDLFSNCHQLKDINLHENGFSLDQILDIEDQLLSPLNQISSIKITEKSLECQLFSKVTYSKCDTVRKVNNLFNIAEHSNIQCYRHFKTGTGEFKNLKDYHDFARSVEKCQLYSIITVIGIAAGNFILHLIPYLKLNILYISG